MLGLHDISGSVRMKTSIRHGMLTAAATVGVAVSTAFARASVSQAAGGEWTERFGVEAGELVSRGRNAFFSLEPGHRLVLANGAEQLVITVLPTTKTVDGVETRVVEER